MEKEGRDGGRGGRGREEETGSGGRYTVLRPSRGYKEIARRLPSAVAGAILTPTTARGMEDEPCELNSTVAASRAVSITGHLPLA